MRRRKNDTRSGEMIQIHILHTDLPTKDIGTICIDCSSDKGRCGAPLRRLELVAGL